MKTGQDINSSSSSFGRYVLRNEYLYVDTRVAFDMWARNVFLE